MTLLLAALRRLHAALLLLLPRDLRRRHGAEMRRTSQQLVEDTLRRGGRTAALAAGAAECLDVVVAAARSSRQAPSEARQDLAYAWRLMWTRPAFTGTVIATLALGIGASTTVFTVVSALLLRPLPYADPDRLVLLAGSVAHRPLDRAAERSAGGQQALSPLDFQTLVPAMPSVASAAAFTDDRLNLTGGQEPERVDASLVSWNFFDVAGASFSAGRGFVAPEGDAGGARVAVISHALWQRRFGGREILGEEVTLDGVAHRVVGVAAPAMTFPGRPQIWRPLVFTPHQLDPGQRGARWIGAIARLRPGVAPARADAEARAAAAALAEEFPRTHRGRSATAIPLQSYLVRDTRSGVLALFGAVVLVLLIASANAANLLLARAAARTGEMRVRMALGASRGRLVRQCVAENLLLTAIASAAGLAVAAWTTRAFGAFPPAALPWLEDVAIDWRVAGFAVAAAVVLAIALGATAALALRVPGVGADARVASSGPRRLRRGLVVAQVAMSLVLLTGAGLFVKSLANLHGVSPGFDPSRVLTFTITMPDASYPEPAAVARVVERLRAELTARPGVDAAAGIFGLPLTDAFGANSTFERIGRPTDPDDEPAAAMRIATPGYFRALRIALMTGRDFSARDTADAPGVAIVNETAARRYWPGENPVGQSLRLHAGVAGVRQGPREIVGIAADVRYAGLDAAPLPEVYIPHQQHPADGLVMVLRSADGDPRRLVPEARAVLQRLDPDLPMAAVATMDEIVAESVAARRLGLAVLSGFAGVALLLAAIGIYGVLSYTVGQRTREIGVRVAMGARRGHVLRLVVGEGLALATAGLAIGAAAATAAGEAVRGLLYGVAPTDPSTLTLVGATLVGVALAASYLPARRAAAVDPVAALRRE